MNEQDEAIGEDDRRLMLRLSGELSSREASRLDEQLAARPELRERLAELETLERSAFGALDQLDRHELMPPRGASVRHAVRAIDRWNNLRLAAEAARRASRPRSRASRWWLYPAAAAALIVAGMIVWWRNTDADSLNRAVAENPVYFQEEGGRSGPRNRGGWQPMQHAFADSLTTPSLDEMDRELNSLTYLRESLH